MTLLLTNSISKAIAVRLLKEKPADNQDLSLNQWKRDVISVAMGLNEANPKFDQGEFLKAAGFAVGKKIKK